MTSTHRPPLQPTFVGNHGEYDPSSAEGQHVLAHELAHVRQQTDGAVSMLPQDDVQLEIDPDPELEREAEETAQRVMQGGKLDIQRMEETDIHVQRLGLSDFNPLSSDDGGASNEDLARRVEILENNQQALFETVSGEGPSADELVDIDADDDQSMLDRFLDDGLDNLNLFDEKGQKNLTQGSMAGLIAGGGLLATSVATGGVAALPAFASIAGSMAAPALRGTASDTVVGTEGTNLEKGELQAIVTAVERRIQGEGTGSGDSQGVGGSQR